MSVLASNLAALGGRLPELARLLADAEPESLEIVPTPAGEASARTAGGRLLHSSRAPRDEAARLAAAAIAPGDDIAVLLGFGLGYSAEACFDAGLERVLVLESSLAALRAALEIRGLEGLLSRGGLAFIVGGDPEAAVSALELSGATRAALVRTKARVDAEPDWYGRAAAAAERWNAKGAVNEATLRRFGKLWVRNLSRNLGLAATESGVDELQGVAAGIPALVLAAGPSLDACLPRLGELARKAVVVCVDTALRSVLGAGIQPDIVVLVDPQYWNWRHVAGLDSPRSILVSESAAWPAAFRRPWRRIFLGGSLFPLGRRIESIAGRKGSLGAGGSVATSAWDLARLMGCSPIWIAGLDLGFPAGGTHARASFFEQRALSAGLRLNPAETGQAGALQGAGGFDGPAAGGGTVRTDKRMALYAWWFESRLARPLAPPTFRPAPGGLDIPGMGILPFEDLLAREDRREEIDRALEGAAAAPRSSKAAGAVDRGLEALRADLSLILEIAEGARAAAERGRAAFVQDGEVRPVLRALDAADAALYGSRARDIAGFLLPPLAEIAGRRARDLGESLSQSAELYGRLADSVRYHLGALPDPAKRRDGPECKLY